MKQERDINRLRNILRYIKVNVEPGKGIDKPISPTDMYHMHLLRDAGFIDCTFTSYKGGHLVHKIFINNSGHDFFDSIEDDGLWKEVEKEVEKKDRKLSDLALPIILNIIYKVGETYFDSQT